MPINKEKLQLFKLDLVARRTQLLESLHRANSSMINDDPFYADSIDQASADSDKTLLTQIKAHDAQVVAQIDEALRRIDLGGFGECERCGDEIALARMKANPATTLCIDCKAELESEQGRFPRRA